MRIRRSVATTTLMGTFLFAASGVHAQYRYTGASGVVSDASVGVSGDVPTVTLFPVTASGFPGQIVNARVSMYLLHAADQELRMSLLSPENVEVPLLQNREDNLGNYANSIGATGANFGAGCVNSARTLFDDAASNQIPTSTAPYVGAFIPAYPYKLAALDGKFGTQVNGTWYLMVTDVRHGNSGFLGCWSLFLDSTDSIFFDGFE